MGKYDDPAALQSALKGLSEIGTTTVLGDEVEHHISYPFIYTTKFSAAEVVYFKSCDILFGISPETHDEVLPLFKQTESGYEFLGNMTFCLDSILKLSMIQEHEFKLKRSKVDTIDIDNNILLSFLLEETKEEKINEQEEKA